ncbi:ARM repeat-containing protein [Myriangium duriaei CBS 260.36]|uniref:ARM repeat-containing protein n=1 Tax=Myriangium duriaei CBS 260.36 TaxID=1168546 RepID=A0A9P4MCT8_9PEZI|nr:ARM repeat-containing protein [Myriangium duriaei CBS 260.36]
MDICNKTLLQTSPAARKALAQRCTNSLTEVHGRQWNIGEGSTTGLLSVILDKSCWPSERKQIETIRGAFQLSLARLINAGEDHIEWAINDIVRILSAASDHVESLADSDAFSILLECLDSRRPLEIRRAAITAIKLLLDVRAVDGQKYLRAFVTAKVRRGTNEELIQAFSAASATFPILPVPAAQLFLTEGFLQRLMPRLQENTAESMDRRSTKLQLSALELLSAVCQDGACRTHVAKYSTVWLQDVAESSPDAESSALAALVLAKTYQVQDEAVTPVSFRDAKHLSTVLGNMLLNAEHDVEIRSIVEGLSYVSMESSVKESIASNERLLHKLVSVLQEKGSDMPLALGVLMIFLSLVQHKPRQTEEQKRVGELKAYAEASKPMPDDPILGDKHVQERCRKLVATKAVSAMVSRVKGASENIASWIVKILFNMAQDSKSRGQMAQQGAIKALLQIYDSIGKAKVEDSAADIALMAAHALARILISVNPNHIFSASMPVVSAIRPLTGLLVLASSESGDLLPTFEGLLALTNLASMDDPSAREATVRTSFAHLEDLLLYQNPKIQQAATELVCNLMAAPQTVALFADGSPAAKHRMHILLALTDAENMPTRRAAGGALAMLTEWDAAVQAVLERNNGVKLVLGLCKEGEGDECLHRGLLVLANVVHAPGDAGKEGVTKVRAAGGRDIVTAALKRTRDANIMSIGIEVLKMLA